MRHIFPVLCVLSLLAALPSAEALQVRFYPAKQLRAYELDPAQGLRSVVLQNVAIINDGEGEIVISRVELDLVEAGVASEIKMLRPPEIDRMAANASQLQQGRSEEHTSELQSQSNLVCRLLLEKKKKKEDHTK